MFKDKLESYIYRLWCSYSCIVEDVLDVDSFYMGFHNFICEKVLGFIVGYITFVDSDFVLESGLKMAVDYESKLLSKKIDRKIVRNGK